MRVIALTLTNLPEVVCAALLSAMYVVVFLQVVFRYVFQNSLPWTEELARILFVWLVFLGASVGVKRRAHFGVDFLLKAVPPAHRGIMLRAIWAASVAFAVVLIVGGAGLMQFVGDNRTPILGIQYAYIYALLPVSGGLMIVYLIHDAWTGFQERGHVPGTLE